jgi:DNA-binding NtrC family response regulator
LLPRIKTSATKSALADFVSDLFYRLNVFPLELPPLRARKEDIPQLATHTISRVSKKHRIPAPRLTPEDIECLRRYDWPGNVRELQNVIARAVILSKGVRLRLDIALPSGAGASGGPLWPSDNRDDVVLTDRECRDRERANVMRALERSAGRVYGRAGAAELLGINPTTLASRLRALKITLPTPRQSRSRVASSTRGVQRPRPRCLLRSRDRNSRIDRIVPPPLRAQRHSPRTGR